MKSSKKNSILFLLLIALASYIAIFPLFKNGFPLTDDGNWMIIRFSAFYEVLRAGQFPVRFLPRLNNGFGYPVADFLYPLFMYLGVPIHVLGFNFQNTIKILMGSSIFLSSVFTFYWLKQKFSQLPAFLGAIVYAYFPYHLFDLYSRGSVGELLALAIVPFIFWQVERKNIILTSIGIALLILAHNSLAFIFLPIIITYIALIHHNDFKKWLFSIGLSLGLTAFFWIPALYDKQFTVFDQVSVSDFSKYFITLQNFNLYGLFFAVLAVTSLVLLTIKRDRRLIYFSVVSLIAVFLTIPLSSIFWKLSVFAGYVQFPFRFISIICLSAAYLSAFQLSIIKNKFIYVILGAYLILLVVSSYGFLKPTLQNYPDSFYSTNQDSTTVKNEYMPKWVEKIPTKSSGEKVTVLKGHQSIQNLFTNGNKISFNFYTPSETSIQINTIYFPGWKVKLDGREVPISYKNENGLIRFSTLSGQHNVLAYFSETPVRLLADFISLVSIGIIFLSRCRKY